MPAMWYNGLVSQNRYVKLTGTWNLCWRAKVSEQEEYHEQESVH